MALAIDELGLLGDGQPSGDERQDDEPDSAPNWKLVVAVVLEHSPEESDALVSTASRALWDIEVLGLSPDRFRYLDGRTRNRGERAAQKDDPSTSPFLISLKAGGTRLNLTAADYVFLLDPWWNPAVESQAVDRAHRIGQTKSVLVYRLIGAETIEERVLELRDRKRGLAKSVLGGISDAPLRSLDLADLKTLLT